MDAALQAKKAAASEADEVADFENKYSGAEERTENPVENHHKE